MFVGILFAALWFTSAGVILDQTSPAVHHLGEKLVAAGEVDHNADK